MCTCHTTVHVYTLHNIFMRLCVTRPVPRLVVMASFPDHPIVHDLEWGYIGLWSLFSVCTGHRLQIQVLKFNLVVASYDIVRNDIQFFRYINFRFCNLVTGVHGINTERTLARSSVFFYRSVNWNYCILDEGHVIKNTKTKVWMNTPNY